MRESAAETRRAGSAELAANLTHRVRVSTSLTTIELTTASPIIIADCPSNVTPNTSIVRTIVRIPSKLAIGLVRGYQSLISPHMAPSCRFTPTCSEYSVQAFRKYGLLRGLILSVHRVLRCHPWGGEGYDPPRWYSEQRATHPGTAANDD